MIGANFSSLLTLPTLLCTLTNAFISFDCNRFCKNRSSCSLDKLSASFNDVTSFDKTVERGKERKKNGKLENEETKERASKSERREKE